MADLTLTAGKRGVNSAAYLTSAAAIGANRIPNAALIAGQARGQLRDFLATAFADADAARAAWVAIGGNLACSNASSWDWAVTPVAPATTAAPDLALVNVAAEKCALRLSTSYSQNA